MDCMWGVWESLFVEMGHPGDKSAGRRTEK